MKSLAKVNLSLVLKILLPGVIVFSLVGDEVIKFWSRGVLNPDQNIIVLMALATLLHGVWYFNANILMSVNSMGVFPIKLLITSLLIIPFGYMMGNEFGLLGVVFSIFIAELGGVCFLILHSRKSGFNRS